MTTLAIEPHRDPLDAELAALPGLDLDELRLRWRRLTRRPAPANLRRDLLARVLAYEMQARGYGPLPREAARLLDRLAAEPDAAATLPRRTPGKPSAGTQLVREYDGQVHRVTVTAAGYVWNGGTYRSLSPIAEAITATRWNGPRFFGLREPKPAEDVTKARPRGRAARIGSEASIEAVS